MNRLLRLFFTLLYNQFASYYNFVAALVSTGLWKNWVFSVLTDDLHPPILEIGFGPGFLLKDLASRDQHVIGLDASYKMSRLALGEVKLVSNDLVVVNGYAQNIPLKSAFFNHVLTTFPAEFIFEEATWQEIRRVLTPHGRVTWLPAAWITGNSLPSRTAAWLFRVTHQAPSSTPEYTPFNFDFITRAGFDVSLEYKNLDRSTVLIVHATKRPREGEENAGSPNCD